MLAVPGVCVQFRERVLPEGPLPGQQKDHERQRDLCARRADPPRGQLHGRGGRQADQECAERCVRVPTGPGDRGL